MTAFKRIIDELSFIPNWLCICTFFVLTGAASDFRFLQVSLAEQSSFMIVSALMAVHLWRFPPPLNIRILLLLAAMVGLLSSIAMSSLANNQMLTIVGTSKYRQLIKVFVIGMGMYVFADSRLERRLSWTIMISLAVLATHASFRFFVLNEFNPETGRLNLLMRHGNANYIASLCGALVFGTLYGVQFADHGAINRPRNMFAALTVICAIVVVIASESRMGMIALVSSALLLGILEAFRKKNLHIFAGIVVIIATASIIGLSTDAFARFSDITDPSSLGRIKGIEAGIQLFADSPFFGVGFDQTPQHIYQITGYPMFRDFASPPLSLHNSWFQMLCEIGLFGFIFFAVYWFSPIVHTIRWSASWKRSCLVASWSCIFLNQQTLPAAYNDAFFALAILPGILTACHFSKPNR
jgi:O-antigen ligase